METPDRRRPWLEDSRPDLWVGPGVFAKIIKRTRQRVHQMLRDGSIEGFGYRTYRDQIGAWYIRISETEKMLVERMKPVNHGKSRKVS